MNILVYIVLLHISLTTAKRRRDTSSSESIENLIYYKDCKSKTTTAPPRVEKLQGPSPAPELFCTMCCGSNCVSTSQAAMRQQQQHVMHPHMPHNSPHGLFNMGQSPFEKSSSNILADIQNRRKRLKPNFLNIAQSRRSFSKDHIKSLISQDDDIKKILKELVRVTMQKVDLLSSVGDEPTTTIRATPTTTEKVDDTDFDDED